VNDNGASELSIVSVALSTSNDRSHAMPVLDATALNTDPDGLEFLRDVLGTGADAAAPNRRFPIEAWTAKPQVGASEGPFGPPAAPAAGRIEPCLAEAALA
jgi:hypothetical protein